MPTIYVAGRRNAGELPLAPTLPAWTIHDNALQITPTLHRVAVGATGRSPATQAQRKRDHPLRGCHPTCIRTSVLNAGELPLAPTLPVWTIIDNALHVSLEQETLATLIRKNIMQQV